MRFDNETIVACVADFPEHNANNDHVAREDEYGRPTYLHTLPERVYFCWGHCEGEEAEGFVRARSRREAALFLLWHAEPWYRSNPVLIKGDGHLPDSTYREGIKREDFDISNCVGPVNARSWIRVQNPLREDD